MNKFDKVYQSIISEAKFEDKKWIEKETIKDIQVFENHLHLKNRLKERYNINFEIWATWNFIDDTDKAEWTAKYNDLPSSEKAQYADAQAYYMAVGRYQIDRGMNVVLMPKNYESLEPQAIAREVVKAYNGGRYYMVGIGNHTMTILVESGVITFKVSDIADTIKVITASGTTTYNGRDAIQYAPNNTDKYVRFEAEWSDGDFVYSNPCWIN